jgi:hypothetical protein
VFAPIIAILAGDSPLPLRLARQVVVVVVVLLLLLLLLLLKAVVQH